LRDQIATHEQSMMTSSLLT